MKKYKVVITDLAKIDIKKAKEYYRNINVNLAKQFLNRIGEAKLFISENLSGNDAVYQDFRMHLIKQFPYHLHYFYDDDRELIVVITVEFGKRENLEFSERK